MCDRMGKPDGKAEAAAAAQELWQPKKAKEISNWQYAICWQKK